MTSLTTHLNNIMQGTVLTAEEMQDVMRVIMNGDATDDQIETLLVTLATRGEAVSEITGAALVMREMAATIKAPQGAIDCCGTGGDGVGTYNISTAVALVCAACDVPVAKHGNRAASSKSGAADVLEALGVNLEVSHQHLEQALEKFNFCFLMAPHHHKAMKHVMPVRKKLGRRTIFNLLGPLANPAGTQFQLIGVYDKKWLEPMAQVLSNLGTKRAWIVHGHDGLDEITISDKTDVAILDNGKITLKTIAPEDYGVQRSPLSEIEGGDATQNAAALKGILSGDKNAYRDIVLLNAAAVLLVHGKAETIETGIQLASAVLDNGAALNTLNNYAAFTKEQSA